MFLIHICETKQKFQNLGGNFSPVTRFSDLETIKLVVPELAEELVIMLVAELLDQQVDWLELLELEQERRQEQQLGQQLQLLEEH